MYGGTKVKSSEISFNDNIIKRQQLFHSHDGIFHLAATIYAVPVQRTAQYLGRRAKV